MTIISGLLLSALTACVVAYAIYQRWPKRQAPRHVGAQGTCDQYLQLDAKFQRDRQKFERGGNSAA